MNLPSGYKLRDRYQIERPLSEQGAFGITYKACDRFFSRDCIVKQLKLENHPDLKRLFEAEYKHLFTLNSHPQVPNLLDYYEWLERKKLRFVLVISLPIVTTTDTSL